MHKLNDNNHPTFKPNILFCLNYRLTFEEIEPS